MLKRFIQWFNWQIWLIVEFIMDLFLPTDCWKCYFVRVILFLLCGVALGVMYYFQILKLLSQMGF